MTESVTVLEQNATHVKELLFFFNNTFKDVEPISISFPTKNWTTLGEANRQT